MSIIVYYIDKLIEMLARAGFVQSIVSNYCGYIHHYLGCYINVIGVLPDGTGWGTELVYIAWVQKARYLFDRAVNHFICVRQDLTGNVLPQMWESRQLPYRKHHEHLPPVPTMEKYDNDWRLDLGLQESSEASFC